MALNILVIEDNEDIGDMLADLLRRHGHDVHVARDGTAGLGLVKSVEPDVVLCDLGLPGMDGIELCRAVRALVLAEQPVMVAITGWGREGDRARTSEAGFDHHLVKPVSAKKLDVVLRAIRS